MCVNSAFKGFLRDRLAVRLMVILMLAISFMASGFTNRSDGDLRAKQVNLLIRQMGHQLLLQAGDLTSRVLPVTEIKEGTFLLAFEKEFAFSHDSLVMLAERLFSATEFPSGYTVTVHECINASIVYGFQSPQILACRGRREVAGCYTIEIALPDLIKNREQKEAEISRPAEEGKSLSIVDRNETPQSAEEAKSNKVEPQENTSNPEEPASYKLDSQQTHGKLKESKSTIIDSPLISLVFTGMVVLVGVAFLIGRFGKRSTPVQVQRQDQPIGKDSVPEVSALGKFSFDVKYQRLILGSEVISLTDKECRVLELLYQNFGELIPRDTLMQKIWIDEGVITGRSLDMFVSKLRKKLSGDPDMKITNVHGKGYKLEAR